MGREDTNKYIKKTYKEETKELDLETGSIVKVKQPRKFQIENDSKSLFFSVLLMGT